MQDYVEILGRLVRAEVRFLARQSEIDARRSFATETVFSHPLRGCRDGYHLRLDEP